MNKIDPGKCFTVADYAASQKLTSQRIYQLIKDKKLKTVKIGSKKFVYLG